MPRSLGEQGPTKAQINWVTIVVLVGFLAVTVAAYAYEVWLNSGDLSTILFWLGIALAIFVMFMVVVLAAAFRRRLR